MTEKEWMECSDSSLLMQEISSKSRSRKVRLVACGWYRCIWAALEANQFNGEEVVRRAVEIAEAIAEGKATEQDVEGFYQTMDERRPYRTGNGWDEWGVALTLFDSDLSNLLRNSRYFTLHSAIALGAFPMNYLGAEATQTRP